MSKDTDILNMLYPTSIKCISCGDELFTTSSQDFLCTNCSIKKIEKSCLKCGRQMSGIAEYCGECNDISLSYDLARSYTSFTGDINKVIYKLKYGNEPIMSYYLAKYLYYLYNKNNFNADIITFVPLHKKRLKKRGYNQSQLLAKELSKLVDIEVLSLLIKNTHTKNLTKLNRKERENIVKNTFSIDEKSIESSINNIKNKLTIKSFLKDKKVLLIDDVLTTGSTANECSRVLKKAGVESVYVLTVASMPLKPILI